MFERFDWKSTETKIVIYWKDLRYKLFWKSYNNFTQQAYTCYIDMKIEYINKYVLYY